MGMRSAGVPTNPICKCQALFFRGIAGLDDSGELCAGILLNLWMYSSGNVDCRLLGRQRWF